MSDLIRRVIDAEIPVAGHIGLTPQSINVMGGYKVQGKTLNAIEQLMRDAVALDRAGVACIYLEGIPREVAAMITDEVETPTIGIGAGPDCDGQVLVFHDLVNLTFGHAAKFVRRYGDAAALITESVLAFKADITSHQFPNDSESYHLPKETAGRTRNRTSPQTRDAVIIASGEKLRANYGPANWQSANVRFHLSPAHPATGAGRAAIVGVVGSVFKAAESGSRGCN